MADTFLLVACCLVVGVILFVVGRATAGRPEKLDNQRVLQERAEIEKQLSEMGGRKDQLQETLNVLREQAASEEQSLRDHLEAVKASLDEAATARKEAKDAEVESYVLERTQRIAECNSRYEESRKFIAEMLDELLHQSQIDYDMAQEELREMKASRDAAVEAARRDRDIADAPQMYQIQLAVDEIHDIGYLEGIMPNLTHPEVIGKCIWSVFFQKKVKQLGIDLLGTETVCGIYKITDRLTGEAYVGQAKDVARRWTDHIKCAVRATPSSNTNLLYTTMRRDGIQNFSFELLEECAPERLDEKEMRYIDLYSCDTCGLNVKRGN